MVGLLALLDLLSSSDSCSFRASGSGTFSLCVALAAPFRAQQWVQVAPDGQVPNLLPLLSRVESQQVPAPQP
jgi:hypothetical protein